MAAVGAEVTGSTFFQSSGVVSFFILLILLSIFLTALCSDCGRRSFELREPEDKNPSALIRVVKLEEAMVARENPMINEIQRDEKDFNPAEAYKVPTVATVSFTALRSQMGEPQNLQGQSAGLTDVQTNGSTVMERPGINSETAEDPEEEVSVTFTPWRNHLRAPQNQDLNSFQPPDSPHVYNTIGGGRDTDTDTSSPAANHQPGMELDDALSDEWNVDVRSVYARITKKERLTPTEHTPEEVQVEGRGGTEPTPPLPGRTAVEG
ncbi:uncharacterized protein LOC141787807 [Halichoeres trimaculatus]|uniref:uncharacterized protein LOC141787807 n=1 Tax=Halichoeres trimaculatus TaxID=147232 RepID=UPI003D9EA83A